MKKPMIPAVSFIKAISALGVVSCHFFTRMANMDTYLILNYLNGSWGDAFVQVFLIVSGFLLHYHYQDNLELKNYAVKRWRGIFPMFYIAYLYFMYGKVCDWRSVFYYGNPWAYLLTLTGMDGYTMARLPSYYIIGEWFLGAIIILYILYPLLRKAFQKSAVGTFAFTAVLYLVFYDRPITNAYGLWTISSCLVSFALGMLIREYREVFIGKRSVAAAVAVVILLVTVFIPSGRNLSTHLMGAALFVILYNAGGKIMGFRPAGAVFQLLGDLSYPIYLLHNQIVPRIAASWQPGNPIKGWALFAITCILTVIAAKVLDVVTRSVMRWADAQIAKRKPCKQLG